MLIRRPRLTEKAKPIRKTRRNSCSQKHFTRRVPLSSENKTLTHKNKRRSMAIRKIQTARRKDFLIKQAQRKEARISQKYIKILAKTDPIDLRCPICMNLMQIPINLSCNHTTCLRCFEQAMVNNPRCPICRRVEKKVDPLINYKVEGAIKAYLNQHPQLKEDFKRDRKEMLKQERKRIVDPSKLRPSDLIDIKDPETNQWVFGRVVSVSELQGLRNKFIRVRIPDMQKWLSAFTYSRKVATAGYFTNDPRINYSNYCKKKLWKLTIKYPQAIPVVDSFDRLCKVNSEKNIFYQQLIQLDRKLKRYYGQGSGPQLESMSESDSDLESSSQEESH